MGISAPDIIAKLDECPAPPDVRAAIAYRILSETNRLDDLINDIMIEYRLGFQDQVRLQNLVERLSKKRTNSDPVRDESAFHLAFGVLPSDEEHLHGYLAEYYYAWAEKLGIPEKKVSGIILELASLGDQAPGHNSS